MTHTATPQTAPPCTSEAPRRCIGLFIHAITSGGAERVMTTLANAWAERGWEVHLVTLDDASVPPFYALHPAVHHHPLAAKRPPALSKFAILWNLVRRVFQVRRALRRLPAEAFVSFIDQTNVLAILALAGTGRPLVISERIDPSMYRIGWFYSALRVLTYPFADRLVVQGERIRRQFHGRVRRRTRIIPNPVPCPAHRAHPERAAEGRFTLAAVGRLVPQKGFDLLIHAFAQLAALHPDWDLVIWGEGPERPALEHLIAARDLRDRVRLPGAIQGLPEAMSRAHLFVLSSRFEGFPNALCEAMALGLPVVAFDCPSGPGDILRHEVDGLLVPAEDAEGLRAALHRLMGDAGAREACGRRAVEIAQRFSLECVLAQWEACIEEVLPR